MMRLDAHVPREQLAALALAPISEPLSDDDRVAFDHLGRCERCSRSLASLTLGADELREQAHREADAIFGEEALAAQRQRILHRLAHLGQAARVLAFPAARRTITLRPVPSTRRWVSVAAAAGLIIGLVAGQTLHFLPGDPAHRQTTVAEPALRSVAPGIVQASLGRQLSDDELLKSIEEASERRAIELRALDELTPVLTEIP